MTLTSWQSLSDVDREREYSPSSCLPDRDYRPFIEAYRIESERSRARVEAVGATVQVVHYGDSPTQTIDVAIPSGGAGDAPVLIFFHGGYWQELSARESFFAAAAAVQQGWAFAAVEYTLAPHASLDVIVDECRVAAATLRAKAPALGLDPSRFVLSGSSAGAHLAAMVGLVPVGDGPSIAGAVLVSGVYELEPLIGTSINEALGLDVSGAHRHSPVLLDVHGFPPTVLAYGDNETDQFMAQTSAFQQHLEASGVDTVAACISGKNHFDVIMDLAVPGTVLGALVANLINSGEADAAV